MFTWLPAASMIVVNTVNMHQVHYVLTLFHRQMLESAVRANRKHMTSLQNAVSKIDQGGMIAECHSSPLRKPHIDGEARGALEQGK